MDISILTAIKVINVHNIYARPRYPPVKLQIHKFVLKIK
jgi:hypothetical protein